MNQNRGVLPRRQALVLAAALALGLLGAASAEAQGLGSAPFGSGSGTYQPLVPVSAFARPAAWFDPSRLHITTSFSVGSGFSGGGSSGLQTTSFSYQFKMPLAMRVSVGNAFGANTASDGKFFLQGLDLAYQPFTSMIVQVHYQNVRSPLQYGYGVRDPFSDFIAP